MRNRGLIIYASLGALCAAFILWQFAEHKRVEEAARQSLMSRGRAITGTLGLVIRTQRRGGGIISQERLESALAELIQSGEIESITLLNAEKEVVVAAGIPLAEHSPVPAGVTWTQERMLLANLVDLGTNVFSQINREPRAIVVRDPLVGGRTNTQAFPRFPWGRGNNARATNETTGFPGRGSRGGAPFGRPPWMTEEEYSALSAQKGLHSFVIAIPTRSVAQATSQDLLMRLIIAALAAAAAGGVAFAWRSFEKSTDLELRLVKASEMNLHLKQMNLAAAGLAHETRNPLNIIRGLAQMISKRPDTAAEVRLNSSAIVEESDRLTAQLNEFISYSRPREVRKATVDLARLGADVARALAYDAEEKRVRVDLNIPPIHVEADEQLLRQILFNLLLNAIQAVGPGETVSIAAEADANNEIVLAVRDTGPGVPDDQRLDIFKPYFTTHEQGSGLGLAIVRQIVLAHGWNIDYLPNEPRGATFQLTKICRKG
jgi:signal transduction histidine kinase